MHIIITHLKYELYWRVKRRESQNDVWKKMLLNITISKAVKWIVRDGSHNYTLWDGMGWVLENLNGMGPSGTKKWVGWDLGERKIFVVGWDGDGIGFSVGWDEYFVAKHVIFWDLWGTWTPNLQLIFEIFFFNFFFHLNVDY